MAASVKTAPCLPETKAEKKPIPPEKRKDVTVDELEKMSLPYPAELYDGKVVPKLANIEHGLIQTNLIRKIGLYLDDNPVGFVITDTNFRLWSDRPRESRIPDVCFISKERMPKDLRRFPAMSPDLAIEVVSPDDSFAKVMDKVDAYLQQGSRIVLLVFPTTREVLICTPEEKRSVRDVLSLPDLLPNFKLKIEDIFMGIKSE
ncbi:MAG: Uma2 family endonuclease [bacterium]